jgi:hypothetical protein
VRFLQPKRGIIELELNSLAEIKAPRSLVK